jgi:DNA modification methylase
MSNGVRINLGETALVDISGRDREAWPRRHDPVYGLRGPIPGVISSALGHGAPSSDGSPRATYAPLELFYADDKADIVIYRGDCRALSPLVIAGAAFKLNLGRADGLVDHVIEDPPYNLRRVTTGDIAITETAGLFADLTIDKRSAMKRDFGEWDEEYSPEPFIRALTTLVRPGGSLISFTSDRLISDFREVEGWKSRGTMVWVKSNPAPSPRPGYVQATEFLVWHQREGAAATWNADGYTINALKHPVCAGNERTAHPTQKPEKLLEELIERHTNPGDLILDRFCGSGTTLVTAKRLGRRAIGIELDPQWCEVAARRVHNAVFETQEGLPFS